MPQDEDIRKEFQKRRETTWRLEKPWIVAMLIGWLGAFMSFGVNAFSEPVRTHLFLLSFVVLIVTIVRINMILSRHYRCPACGKMPIGGDGVLLDPVECPKCGAALK